MSQYVVTLRWYVETDEAFEAESAGLSLEEKENKILDLLRHRSDGSPSCGTCPTRNNENFVVLDWHKYFKKKEIYISTDKIQD